LTLSRVRLSKDNAVRRRANRHQTQRPAWYLRPRTDYAYRAGFTGTAIQAQYMVIF